MMLLKYFYDTKLAHASYLVGCQATNEALIVDPGRDVAIYLQEVERQRMRLAAVVETHIHADYVSGARELAVRTGASLYLSDEGEEPWKYQFAAAYDHRLLRDGDRFNLGRVWLEALHTPGHTPEHLSFLLTDTVAADQPLGIFTGDFLFVGAVGRPDLLEKAAGFSDTAVAGARDQFHSLQRLRQLPDHLQVWPAHGAGSACGKGLGSIPSTTIGYEKLFNPALKYSDEAEFIDYLLADQPEPPKYFAVMKRVNKEGPTLLCHQPRPPYLPPEQLGPLLDEQAAVVDTRSAGVYATGHLPGSINIPADMLSTWAGWLLDYNRPFYLIAAAGQIETVLRDLAYIGLDNVGGYFDDTAVSFLAERGHNLQTYAVKTPTQLADTVLNDEILLLDIRSQSEWEEGHIPGAHHLMLGYLPDKMESLLDGRPIVVYCRSGARSAVAASLLKAAGAADVTNMIGAFRDWQAAGLPVAT